jgi:glycosyltransferase involved in cell wall biosynthesis
MQMWHRFRGSFDLVNRFIALSQFSRSKFVAGGLPSGRITVKANFLTNEVEPGEGAEGNALFVGRLSEEKGLEVLLAAWRHLKSPIRLTIIGDGPLAGQVKTASDEDARIKWLGRLPQEQVYAHVAQAGFLVLPSACYENFPKTIVEAYAHGTPVLASDHGSLRELVTPGVTGFTFRPGDPADLAKQIETFPMAGRDYIRLRAEARQTYLSRFTADENWRQLLNIYEGILPSSRASTTCNFSSSALALAAERRESPL